jgi:predicted phage terminase large subunit-like protein
MGFDALPSRRPVAEDAYLGSIMRTDFGAFAQKVFGTVARGHVFLPNWHIDAICHELSKVMSGETKRLIIGVPPRHLKSICSSVALPAWALGLNPTRRIIGVSYAQDLAVKHGNDCRAVLDADWYQRLFPDTKIDPAKDAESEVMTTQRGFRFSTSVGGVLTGRGGDLIIIDDPLKPEDAMSDTVRKRVIEWCGTTLFSRLDDKEHGAIILVMQRLHVDDLAGHFLQQGGWKHLSLPAIAETDEHIEIGPARYHIRRAGELLHPARDSQATLDRIKREMGSAAFSAQYQQAPVPAGGNMIKWDWFGWYEPNLRIQFEQIVISWDTAMKATQLSDYSVGTVWGAVVDIYFLLDLVRVRLEYPALKRKVIEVYRQWPTATVLIEEAGSGTSLIQDLREQKIPIIAIRPQGDKVMRMSAQSAKIEAGAVQLPRNAPFLDDLRSEILAFPYSRHNDQVDSLSQALHYMSQPRHSVAAVGVPLSRPSFE